MLRYATALYGALTAVLVIMANPPSAVALAPLQKISFAQTSPALVYMLHYLAEGKDFYKEEGLAPDDVTVSSGTQQAASVMGGSTDVSITGFAEAIYSIAKGGDLVVIATSTEEFPFSIMLSDAAVKKSGITDKMTLDEKVKRLKGLNLGISAPSTGGDIFIRLLLSGRGMNADQDITLRPVGAGASMLAAFQQGVIDGFISPPPFPQIAVGQGAKIVIYGRDVPEYKNTVFNGIVTSRATLEKRRPLLLAAVRAWTKAIKFAHDQPAEAKRVIRAAFPTMSDADFDRAYADSIGGIPQSPVATAEQVQNTVAIINLTQKTPIKVDYLQAVYPDLARQAEAAILTK